MAEAKDTNNSAPVKANKPKMVTIKLPLTRKEQDDVFVAVNGKSFLITRGKEVEVPEYVAKVLKNKEDMLAEAMAFELANAPKD